jgi:dTDP-4-dehydrorhamnose reductase
MANPSGIAAKCLLFGSRGMIGSALAKSIPEPALTAFSHRELDITDYLAVEKVFVKTKPNVVLNAAAFTRVDDCEKFQEPAFVVNAQAPGHLAALCKKYNSLLVHFSTDYIFDGNASEPYIEDHPANPINYYGTTKWEGDKKILSSGCSFLMIRTSWIFGKNGENFVTKLLKRALAGAPLKAPQDQTGRPTYAEDVADAVLKLLVQKAEGIFHFANSGLCSRLEQARTILKLYGLNNPVEAATNESLSLPAKRPHYSVLDISYFTKKTGVVPRTWQQSTTEYISFLKQNEHELR